MSNYTMTLGEVIDYLTPNGGTSINDRIEKGRTQLFDFDYGFYDSTIQKDFETHFIRKFYNREIGTETEGLFKFNLETWLLINMPFFNKLFESELIDYDPLVNAHMEVSKTISSDSKMNGSYTSDGTNNSNATDSSNASSDGSIFERHLESNNPDSRVSITPNADGSGTIEYASEIVEDLNNNNATATKSSTSTNSNASHSSGSSNGEETETKTESDVSTGKVGAVSYSKMLNEYRDSILRIENMMFKEMEQLFMLVY